MVDTDSLRESMIPESALMVLMLLVLLMVLTSLMVLTLLTPLTVSGL
jgi:hypothetical protein